MQKPVKAIAKAKNHFKYYLKWGQFLVETMTKKSDLVKNLQNKIIKDAIPDILNKEDE